MTLNLEAKVAAPENAPVRTVMVKDGDQVTKDQPLVQLDDNQAQRQFEAAVAKHKSAQLRGQARRSTSVTPRPRPPWPRPITTAAQRPIGRCPAPSPTPR